MKFSIIRGIAAAIPIFLITYFLFDYVYGFLVHVYPEIEKFLNLQGLGVDKSLLAGIVMASVFFILAGFGVGYSDTGNHEPVDPETVRIVKNNINDQYLSIYKSHNIQGNDDLILVDVSYRESNSPRKSRWVNKTITCLKSSQMELPVFQLRPNNVMVNTLVNFGSALANASGGVELPFISIDNKPKFTRLYLLLGQDKDRVRKLFDDQLINFLEFNPGYMIESQKGNPVISYKNMRLNDTQINDFVSDAKLILDMLDKSYQRNLS